MPSHESGDAKRGTYAPDPVPPDEHLKSQGDKSTLSSGLGSSVPDLGQEVADDEPLDDLEIVDLSTRYEIQEELGQGGMGRVLKAFDKRLQRPVAVKRILEKHAGRAKTFRRFLTEARSVAALNHFYILQVYDYGRDEQGPFLILEFVDGRSLDEQLQEGPLKPAEAVELAVKLCDALACAHAKGVIHRDIKPSNILLTADGEPKLCDFGLARQEIRDRGLTRAGAMLGTLDYMPPEQKRDAREADDRSDQWSLAATLYHMVTANSPRVIRLDLVPEPLRGVLGKALEDDPSARYASVTEFRDALKAALARSGGAEKWRLLSPGQCRNCSHVGDAGRKYCSACGVSLEEPCLACGEAVWVWEKFCGHCGADLIELVAQKAKELQRRFDEIDSLRREYRQPEALQKLLELKVPEHPSLTSFREQAEKVRSSLKREIEQQQRRRDDVLAEVRKLFEMHEYGRAGSLLLSIPEAFRNAPTAELFEECRVRAKEMFRLWEEIRQAIKARRYTGLLEKTTRYLELCPEDKKVRKLHQQLEERQRRLEQKSKPIVAKARQLYEQGHSRDALKLLERLPHDVTNAEVDELRRTAKNHIIRARKQKRVLQFFAGFLLTLIVSCLMLFGNWYFVSPTDDSKPAEPRPTEKAALTEQGDGDEQSPMHVTAANPPAESAERPDIGKQPVVQRAPEHFGVPTLQYNSPDGILLRYDARQQDWLIMPRRAIIHPGERLISPEPFDANIEMVEGALRATALGGTSVRILPPSQMAVVGFDVGQGRLILRRIEGSRVRADADRSAMPPLALKVGNNLWSLELGTAGTVCGVEITPLQPDRPEQVLGPDNYTAALYVRSGSVRLAEAGGDVKVINGEDWLSLTPQADDEAAAKPPLLVIPEWLDPGAKSTLTWRRFADLFEKEFHTGDFPNTLPLSQNLALMVKHNRSDISALAVKCLALIGDYESLASALNAEHEETRMAAIEGLRNWLPSAEGNGQLLKEALAKQFPDEDAGAVNRLLWGYHEQDARDPETSRQLVDWLTHNKLVIRELAFYHIYGLTGRKYDYHPLRPPAQRVLAVRRWHEHIQREGALINQ